MEGKSAIEKMLNRIRYPCGSGCKPYDVVFMDQEMPEMNGVEGGERDQEDAESKFAARN